MNSRTILLAPFLAMLAPVTWVGIASGDEMSDPGVRPVRVTLGVDLGLSILDATQGSDNTTVLAVPSYVGAYLPAFRLGFLAGRMQEHEVYLKSGFLNVSDGGSYHMLSLTGNYQFTFPTAGESAPYLTIGGGIMNVGGDLNNDTSPIVGGGVGGRFRVDEDHGALRLEARIDHVSEGDTSIRGANVISLLMGFELWMR